MGNSSPKPNPHLSEIPSSLPGKVILITGGTSGLGAASAALLALRNPQRIYISGRRAAAAATLIQQLQQTTTADIQFLPCDLTDLSSVHDAAQHLLAHESHLDILMANAGVAAVPAAPTRDGYEVHFGVNHVGHALLIRKLLPLLQRAPEGGRIVSVSSFGYRQARWGLPLESAKAGGRGEGFFFADWDWLGAVRWMRYAESKLANVVYARELAMRYPGVVSVSVSPGFVGTSMISNMRVCDRVMTRLMSIGKGGMVEAEVGALSQVWAATVEKEKVHNGGMYDPVGVESELTALAKDEKLGRRLWEWTEREIERWL